MRLEFQENADSGPRIAAPPAAIVAAPPPRLDFDLPKALRRQLVLVMTLYLAVMALAFGAAPGMGLLFAVFAVTTLAYYGLPLLLQRAGGTRRPAAERDNGVETASGWLDARAAYAQVMTVPLLMLAWAVFVAVIK
ncbi:hypothetical protein IP88_10395 [alpha proteobacterium AAP81b]|nr:hypothetical protein IP88_10395 [alpha proteobacterium AAP81b]